MNRTRGPRLATVVLWTAAAVGGMDESSRAAAIHPWSGAGAQVRVFDRIDSATGASAVQSAEGEAVIDYEGVSDRYQVRVRGAATAEASGRPEGLLRVDTSYSTGNPGTRPRDYRGTEVRALATWTDDAVSVRAPEGTRLPEAVRLHFALDFGRLRFGSLALTFNDNVLRASEDEFVNQGTRYQYKPQGADRFRELFNLNDPPEGIDSYDPVHRDDPDTGRERRVTFHLDLPVDDAGVSAPFSLGLESVPSVGLVSNQFVSADHRDFTVSLTDVRLPDGTPLTSQVYAVSFASGLSWSEPVPEPASLAIWGLVACVAGRTARRRARSGGAICGR